MKKVDINRILTDVLSVVFNNEGSNSPEDITDYVDSETILDYMLEDLVHCLDIKKLIIWQWKIGLMFIMQT